MTITEAQDQLTTCEIQTAHGWVAVVAEATETPGLYVTPELAGGGFTGAFTLTRGPSGCEIPMGWDGAHVDQVRTIARSLGTTPVDWTVGQQDIGAQLTEHREAVIAARRDAKYPPVEADGVATLGAYPRTEAEATAENIAVHLTAGLQHRTRDTWEIVGRRDADGLMIRGLHAAALVAEWALVHVLREFAKVDQRAADATAREIWDAWEDGSTVHEIAWDWAREYGLPELPEKTAETVTPAAEVKA